MLPSDEYVMIAIFIVTFALILSERFHRTTAAMAGAVFMVTYGIMRGLVTEQEAITYIRWDVIALLLGMMILVGVLSDTGVFEAIGIYFAKRSRGNPWFILVSFSLITTFFSMFVDNVTTVLLMFPITMSISGSLGLDPVPILISEAILSDIGGVATLVGDPPNVMIASYAGFGFNDFIVHLMVIVLISLTGGLLLLRLLYRTWGVSSVERLEEISHESPLSRIKNWNRLRMVAFIFSLTIALFILHQIINVEPFAVALLGGTMALFVTRIDPQRAFQYIEWPSLLFFAALFVIVGMLEHIGTLHRIAEWTVNMTTNNVLIASLAVLWISTIASAFIDNIPFTAAMAPVIARMNESGMNVNPLWWALAMGVGFGGNITPIGSSANIITCGLSEKFGKPITMKEWLSKGTPIAIMCTLIATAAILLFPGFFR